MASMARRCLTSSVIRNAVKLSASVASRNLSSQCTPLMLGRALAVQPQFPLRATQFQVDTRRFFSSEEDKSDYISHDVNIADVMHGVLHKSFVMIDVREPDELARTGKIGNAINIPEKEVEKAFLLSDEEFKGKYHIYKPNIMSERVVVYCKTGKRALRACAKLDSMGYNKIKRYPGGMKEWTEILFGKPLEEDDKKKKEE